MAHSAVKSTSGSLDFNLDGTNTSQMSLSSTGLAIGENLSATANLYVEGSAIVSESISVGTTSTSSNLNIGGSFSQTFITLSDNTSYVGTPLESSMILVDTTSGNIRLDLPYPSRASNQIITIKKISSNNELRITGGGKKVDGSYDWHMLSGDMSYLKVLSNSTQWNIIDSGDLTSFAYSGNMILTVDTSVDASGDGGTAANFFTLPLLADGLSATINWGDGSSNIQSDDNFITHDYGAAATYTVQVSGTFKQLKFQGANDDIKVLELQQWGPNAWDSMLFSFYGCSNMKITAADLPDTSSVTSFYYSWNGCSSLENFPYIDTSSGTVFNRTWNSCTSLTSFPVIDLSSLTDGTNILQNVTLSTYVWSNILIETEANNPVSNINYFKASSSTKHNAAGNVAMGLLDARGWVISDGGLE
ncbi:MAG: hypothetical protein HQL32_06710 [Planctomycetes bacterium]|nr:hypothetical protein [Planctomycetota bacterium]